MIITIIFPQKIIHRGLCQNWFAQPLEHMVQILCGECGESGRMPLWRCSTDCQRLPALSASFLLFISRPHSSVQSLFSGFPTCATNHLDGFPWHLLCFSRLNRNSKADKWSMVMYPFILENHTVFPNSECILMRSKSSKSTSSYFLFLHQIRKIFWGQQIFNIVHKNNDSSVQQVSSGFKYVGRTDF